MPPPSLPATTSPVSPLHALQRAVVAIPPAVTLTAINTVSFTQLGPLLGTTVADWSRRFTGLEPMTASSYSPEDIALTASIALLGSAVSLGRNGFRSGHEQLAPDADTLTSLPTATVAQEMGLLGVQGQWEARDSEGGIKAWGAEYGWTVGLYTLLGVGALSASPIAMLFGLLVVPLIATYGSARIGIVRVQQERPYRASMEKTGFWALMGGITAAAAHTGLGPLWNGLLQTGLAWGTTRAALAYLPNTSGTEHGEQHNTDE
jgi:hypothetical protein